MTVGEMWTNCPSALKLRQVAPSTPDSCVSCLRVALDDDVHVVLICFCEESSDRHFATID